LFEIDGGEKRFLDWLVGADGGVGRAVPENSFEVTGRWARLLAARLLGVDVGEK
jgi:hypothetical protein